MEPLKIAVLTLNQDVKRYSIRGYLPQGYVNPFSAQQFGRNLNNWQKRTPTESELLTEIVGACEEILTRRLATEDERV
jgi:hypothetical protein